MTPVVNPAAEINLHPALRQAVSRNGSPSHEYSHPSPPRSRRTVNIIAAAGFLLLVLGVGGYLYYNRTRPQRADLLYHTVRKEPLSLTVVERGALESAANRDVICRVRAGTKATNLTIKWVIDDGSVVKQGQLLMEIDDSALQDQLKVQKIALDTARSKMLQAEDNHKIVASQAASDLQTAKVELELKQIDLTKYEKGDYQKDKKDIENRLELARSDVEQQTERVSYTERMVKMTYLSPAQLQAENSKLMGYQAALKKVEEERRVLENYTKNRTITDFTNQVEEAKRKLERTIIQNKARISQSEIEMATNRSIFEQEEDKLVDIEEQIANCRIFAPQDGLVVYFIPEERRGSSNEVMIANGATVREGQKLMRIPDLTRMVVNTRVHEAMVSRVKGDEWQQTGGLQAIRVGELVQPDALSRLVASHAVLDVKEGLYKYDHELIRQGQKAQIRIDSIPNEVLAGHVKSIATVASQQDWMSADVKVYQTFVAIHAEKSDSLDGWKPGMSAEVTIHVEGRDEPVLTLPLTAVIGGAEMGTNRKVYVKTPDGPKERDITIGLANEKVAEVIGGLQEGDEVVVNPRVLLGDKVRVRLNEEEERSDGEGKQRKRGSKGGDGKGKGGVKPGSMPSKSGGPPLAGTRSKGQGT